MKQYDYFGASRRRFMGIVSGVFSGFFLWGSGCARTPESDIKQMLDNLSVEALINAAPKRHPAVYLRSRGKGALLFRSGFREPIAEINETGRRIWKRCSGNTTPGDISAAIAEFHEVDAHQAFVDCLHFLARLKAKNAILI